MKDRTKIKGAFEILIALGISTIIAAASYVQQRIAVSRVTAQIRSIDHMGGFYGGEVSALIGLYRHEAGLGGAGTADADGRFVATIDNTYGNVLPSSVPNTPYQGKNYIPQTPLSLAATRNIAKATAGDELISRYSGGNELQFSLPSATPGDDSVCGSQGFPGGYRTSVCLRGISAAPVILPLDVDLKIQNSDGPIAVAAGTNVLARLVTSGATQCARTYSKLGYPPGPPTTIAVNGNYPYVVTESHLYTVTCSNSSQTKSDSVQVNLPPSVDLKVCMVAVCSDGPLELPHNSAYTFNWSTQNATFSYCALTRGGGPSQTVGATGSDSGTLTAPITIFIQCTTVDGAVVTDSAQITLPALGTVDVKAARTGDPLQDGMLNLPKGTSVTVAYTFEDVTGCQFVEGSQGLATTTNVTANGSVTKTISAYTDFSLNCWAGSVFRTDSIAVSVEDPPTIDLKGNINGGTVQQGPLTLLPTDTSLGLQWSSTGNPKNCQLYSSLSPTRENVQSSYSKYFGGPNKPTSSVTYFIECQDKWGGTIIDSLRVNISQHSIDLKASSPPAIIDSDGPIEITQGDTVILNWTNELIPASTQCTLSRGGPVYSINTTVGPTGSLTMQPASHTATITCTVSGKTLTDTIVITAKTKPVLSISARDHTGSFSSNVAAVLKGSSHIVRWSSSHATSCSIKGVSALNHSGYNFGAPNANTTYTLSCTGEGGTETASVLVNELVPYNRSVVVKAKCAPNGPSSMALLCNSGDTITNVTSTPLSGHTAQCYFSGSNPNSPSAKTCWGTNNVSNCLNPAESVCRCDAQCIPGS